MWVRTLKITLKNQIMKDSIESYIAEKVDLMEGMFLGYWIYLLSSDVLVNHSVHQERLCKASPQNLNQFVNKSSQWGQRLIYTTVRFLSSK